INLVTRTATIDLDAGESITVTFTNTKRGGITVVKDRSEERRVGNECTSALSGPFRLDDDAGVTGGDNTLLNSASFNSLTPGTYVITESALPGSSLTRDVITDPDNGSSINLVTRTATIDLDAGESITVTFTNTKRGGITVVKN